MCPLGPEVYAGSSPAARTISQCVVLRFHFFRAPKRSARPCFSLCLPRKVIMRIELVAHCVSYPLRVVEQYFVVEYDMTLTLIPIDHEDLCHGWAWTIKDELALAERVARVALGQYRHVAKILAGANVPSPGTSADHAT